MGLFGEPSVNDGLRNDVVGVTEILVVDENCSHYPSGCILALERPRHRCTTKWAILCRVQNTSWVLRRALGSS